MKNYIGSNIKEIDWKFGSFLSVRLNVDDLVKIRNSKGYCNLIISKRKEVGKFGETHLCYQNEYSGDKKEVNQVSLAPEIPDIPF